MLMENMDAQFFLNILNALVITTLVILVVSSGLVGYSILEEKLRVRKYY